MAKNASNVSDFLGMVSLTSDLAGTHIHMETFPVIKDELSHLLITALK